MIQVERNTAFIPYTHHFWLMGWAIECPISPSLAEKYTTWGQHSVRSMSPSSVVWRSWKVWDWLCCTRAHCRWSPILGRRRRVSLLQCCLSYQAHTDLVGCTSVHIFAVSVSVNVFIIMILTLSMRSPFCWLWIGRSMQELFVHHHSCFEHHPFSLWQMGYWWEKWSQVISTWFQFCAPRMVLPSRRCLSRISIFLKWHCPVG